MFVSQASLSFSYIYILLCFYDISVVLKVREVFAEYDPHFLPMSLDEAYLDITEHLELRQHWPESRRTYQINEVKTTGGIIPVKYEHINITIDFRVVHCCSKMTKPVFIIKFKIVYAVSLCHRKLKFPFIFQ